MSSRSTLVSVPTCFWPMSFFRHRNRKPRLGRRLGLAMTDVRLAPPLAPPYQALGKFSLELMDAVGGREFTYMRRGRGEL